MNEKTSIIIAGAGGRMGKAIATTVLDDPDFELDAAFDMAGANVIGTDIGELSGLGACDIEIKALEAVLRDFEKSGPTVLIDFTMPAASVYHAGVCAEYGFGHVIGTTGFSPEEDAIIADKSKSIPIIKAGNMSTGVTLLSVLVEQAAAALGNEFDIEITEAHHRHKIDAPSGTALLLGDAVAAGRKVDLHAKSVRTRDGITGARKSGDIGFSVIRGGGIIGDHNVMFASEGEILTLSHHATDRKLFAEGALRASKWLSQDGTSLQKSGLYSMRDVLGLSG